jgi:uncharacterized protein (DUF1501 family)
MRYRHPGSFPNAIEEIVVALGPKETALRCGVREETLRAWRAGQQEPSMLNQGWLGRLHANHASPAQTQRVRQELDSAQAIVEQDCADAICDEISALALKEYTRAAFYATNHLRVYTQLLQERTHAT